MPFEAEIAPGESGEVAVVISGVRAGRYSGFVDVVLDGSSWVRSEVSFEVADPLPGPR